MKTTITFSTPKKSITGFFNHIKINAGLLSLLFVLFFINEGFATNYYIAPSGTGNDANNGTAVGTPKLTLASVFSTYNLGTGDIIYVAAGTYTEKGIVVGTDDEGFTIQGAALSSGVPTSIFDSDQTERWLRMSADANDNISFVNLKIKDYKPSNGSAGGGICYSSGASSSVVYYDITGITITNCFFDNCDPATGYNGGAIYYNRTSAGSSSTISITGCSFYNSNATVDGAAIYIYSANAITASFSKSKFYDNSTGATAGGGYAFYIGAGTASTLAMTNCLVHSNSNTSNGSGAIYIATGVTMTAYNNTIYNNTCSSCQSAGIYNAGTTNIYNSILKANSVKDFHDAGTANAYNCFYDAWYSVGGSGSVTTAANVTNAATDDYTLLSTSACINAGLTASAPSDDITGASRVGNPDIGCYEYICPEFYNTTYEVGATGKWATLTAAIAALKLCMTDDVILELQSTYDPTGETFPINFTGLPTSLTATLTVRPKTGVTETITSSNATGTILLDGADYVYFNGSPGGANTMSNANNLTISNTSTTGYVFKFINDATYNKIEYCNIRGVNTSASNGSIWFSTGAASGTGNEYNQINYCEIYDGATKPTNAIFALGDATINNNITINGNYIYNFFNASVNSSGVFLSDYNTDWNITNNKFYQTAAVDLSSNVSHRPVYINFTNIAGNNFTVTGNTIGFANSSSTGTYDFTGHITATTSGVFTGIHLKVGTTTASTVSANTIAGITLSDIRGSATASVEGAFNGIAVLGGSVTIGSSGNANVIGSSSPTSNITFYSGAAGNRIYGVYLNTTGTVTVAYNTIGGFSTGASSGAAIGYEFAGIYNYTTGTKTISNNTIGSATTANSIEIGLSTTTAANLVYGINNAAAATINFDSNTIQNLTNYTTSGSAVLYGIYNASGATSTSFTSNTISTLKMMYDNSTSGTSITAITCGIYTNSPVATTLTSNTISSITCKNGLFKGLHLNSNSTHTINSNTISDIAVSTMEATTIYGVYNATTGTYNMKSNSIKNLISTSTSAHATVISGIWFEGVNASSTIQKNKITGFSCTQSSTPIIYGIYNKTSGAVKIFNNLFICNNGGNTNNCKIFGVYDNGATVSTSYYNTISISGSTASGADALSSACFAHNNSTVTKVILKNNIFQNSRTGSANNHYSYYLNVAGNANGAGSIDYNYYYNATDATFAYPGAVKNKDEMTTTNPSDIRTTLGYGGANSVYATTSPITINDDGTLSDAHLAIVTRGTNLNGTSGCESDIYYVARNVAGGYRGCYESPCLIIATQPLLGSICIGGTYSPSIVVTNASTISVSFSYKMQFASDDSAFVNVADSTPANSIYTNGTGSPSSVGIGQNATYAASVNGDIAAGSAYYYRYLVTSDAGCSLYTNSKQLTVNADPSISDHPSAGTICFRGTYSPSITASGGTSLTYQWEYSSNNSTWGNVVNGTPTNSSFWNATSNNLTQNGNIAAGINYYYRCIVSDAGSGCGSVASNAAQLTVNPTSAGGSISGGATVSSGTNSTVLTLSDNTGSVTKWQSSTASDFSSAVTDISNTTTSLTATDLTTTTYYRAVVTSGVCASANSTIETITVNASCDVTNWTGALSSVWADTGNWDCGVPTDQQDVVIPDVTNDPIISSDAVAKSLTVKPGAVLTVSSATPPSVPPGTLTVTNAVVLEDAAGVIPAGSLIFKNGSSLLQDPMTTANANTGKIVYERTTSVLNNNYDFVYWSSPVASQKLGEIWMASNWADTFYFYDVANTNYWGRVYANDTMTPGVGYIARSRNGQPGTDYNGFSTTFYTKSGTSDGKWTAKFYGVPNNGDITVPIVKAGTAVDNLIGNPYPSALDLNSFYQTNKLVLNSNFYFWTHGTAISANTYTASDYATYNAAIGALVGTAPSSNTSMTPPTSYVAAGQGFFASAASARGNGSVNATFSNAHRVSGQNNIFYRPAQQTQSRNAGIESHKIWLNLSNDKGAFKQQLLAYAQGATLDFDTNLEAVSYEYNVNLDFYSNLSDYKLIIQSRPLPFNTDDRVPLTFKSATAETYQIAIDHVDGLFLDGQAIYLEDKLQNVIHDLKQGAYTFTTSAGTFNDRFVVRYTNSALGNEHFDFSNSVQAIVNDKVTVYAGVEPIQSIEVIDLLGRTIRQYDKINATTYTLGNLFKNDKVLFLKIKLSNQVVVTKKIVF